MKLALLHTATVIEGIGTHRRSAEPLISAMPKRKQQHSARVAKHLHSSGVGQEGVYAGLLHDYLERGGDLGTLQQHIADLGLPPRIVQIIAALSSHDYDGQDESPFDPVISHLVHSLPKLDRDTRDIAILAKMADRLDNLTKRVRRDGRIGPNYRSKSIKLIQFLGSHYNGNSRYFKALARAIAKLLDVRAFGQG